jgi:hypothetical protein
MCKGACICNYDCQSAGFLNRRSGFYGLLAGFLIQVAGLNAKFAALNRGEIGVVSGWFRGVFLTRKSYPTPHNTPVNYDPNAKNAKTARIRAIPENLPYLHRIVTVSAGTA